MKFEFAYEEKYFCTCGKNLLYVMKNIFVRDEIFVCTCANFHLINS